VVYDRATLERMRDETLAIIERDGSITLAGFRDHFGTSRKYALAFLDYFDRQGITTRKGDVRLTAKRP